jgi:hypothetical protein
VGEKFYVTVIEAEEKGIKRDEEQIPHPPDLQLLNLLERKEDTVADSSGSQINYVPYSRYYLLFAH